MRDRGRLRRLRMRVEREDGLTVLPGQLDQGPPQAEARRQHGQDAEPLPHPVHRHVDVVAAPGGVQAPGDGLAAAPDEQAVDVEEQVLAGAVERGAADAAPARQRPGRRAGFGRPRGTRCPAPRASPGGRGGPPAAGRGTAPWRRRSSRAGRSGRSRERRSYRRQQPPYGITNSCCESRTVSTGQGDLRTTFSATLPSSMWAIGPRPCVPMTIRSTPCALA